MRVLYVLDTALESECVQKTRLKLLRCADLHGPTTDPRLLPHLDSMCQCVWDEATTLQVAVLTF